MQSHMHQYSFPSPEYVRNSRHAYLLVWILKLRYCFLKIPVSQALVVAGSQAKAVVASVADVLAFLGESSAACCDCSRLRAK